MHIDLTKAPKVQEVMKKLGYKEFSYKNFRKMVLYLYNSPVKPGFRAIAKFLGVNPYGSIKHIITTSKHRHRRGGIYRTMDNIVKDLDMFVNKGEVDEELVGYTPSLRAFIEKCGGKGKVEKNESLNKGI